MRTTSPNQRPSGIHSVGGLPWGSHIGVFCASEQELLDLLVPFVRAGLENNELCRWELRAPVTLQGATQALRESVPEYPKHASLGQIEFVERSGADEAIGTRLETATRAGFDGLRLVRPAVIDTEGQAIAPGVDSIPQHDVVAAFLYPSSELSAAGLLRAVQQHCFGLVHSSGAWQVLALRDAARAADQERELTIEFLRLVNANARMADLIQASVAFFQERSGCHAVGLRLKSGDHYPYYEARGFSDDFLSLENDLRARDERGEVLSDRDGKPMLECMCGNVICAQGDFREPFSTDGGSYWTNDTGQLSSTATDSKRRLRTRNRCRIAGYASVALVPLYLGGERLGLVQFNDRRKGMFTPEAVAMWERLASHLAVALSRCLAAEALVRSETRYRILFENLLDGFAHCRMLYDGQGQPCDFVHLDVNEAFKTLTGLGDVVGKRATELVPDFRSAVPELFDTLARVASTGRPERIQVYFSPLTLWLNVSAYSPEPGHFIALVDDITVRKSVEVEREKLLEALRDVDEKKNQFLAALSHELRNPLAPIKNSLHILERAAPGGDQAKRAKDVIDRQVEQLARLVSDLLDVTRINRGKVRLERRRLELNDLARRTIEDYRSLFDRSGVTLRLEPASSQVCVEADWNRMAQVIGNLLQNAAKFTPRGGTVTVVVAMDPAEARAVIRVSDTGIGMNADVLARLFQPFMQAEATLDRSKGGLGLGLVLIKGLVEQQGGSVEAHSEGLGQGSRFTVRLPLDVTEPEESTREQALSGGARRRVLLIEDNTDAAESLREVLELEDHDVAVAYSGPDGLAKARAFRPDFILCDIGLPGMDGYEVARVMRADPTLRGTCLVALSGYALPEDIERSREAGFDRHIAKPPSLQAIEELLARAGPSN